MKKSIVQIEFERKHSIQDLGPNWKTVLNFWLFFEGLSEEQLDVLGLRNNMPNSKRQEVDKLTVECVQKVISAEVKNSIPLWSASLFATFEIIAAQEILDEAGELTFLPMFDGL